MWTNRIRVGELHRGSVGLEAWALAACERSPAAFTSRDPQLLLWESWMLAGVLGRCSGTAAMPPPPAQAHTQVVPCRRRCDRAERAEPAARGVQAGAGAGGGRGLDTLLAADGPGAHSQGVFPWRLAAGAGAGAGHRTAGLALALLPFVGHCLLGCNCGADLELGRAQKLGSAEGLAHSCPCVLPGWPAQVPKGHVWLQGDNFNNSTDSRHYGPVPYAMIRGRVFVKVRCGPALGLPGARAGVSMFIG